MNNTAKADWLRSEIEKLEGMNVVLDNGASFKRQTHYPQNVGYNTALTTLITRYKEELKDLTGE